MDNDFKRGFKRLKCGKGQKLNMGLNAAFERIRSKYIEMGPAESRKLDLSRIVEPNADPAGIVFADSRRRGNGKLMVPSMSSRDSDLEMPIFEKKANVSSNFFRKFKLGQIKKPRRVSTDLKTWSLAYGGIQEEDSTSLNFDHSPPMQRIQSVFKHRSHTNLTEPRQQPDISDPNKKVFKIQRFKSLGPDETE
jgi:hypothetical protein